MTRALFIFFFLLSCTKSQNQIRNDDIVDFSSEESSRPLTISKESHIEYGPGLEVKMAEGLSESPEPIVALILYSSLYSSLSYIDLLYELERFKVKVPIISSSGFGALIMALYAQKKSLSYMEWKLFPLLKGLKSIKPYSSKWYRVVDTFIDKEFKRKKLEHFRALLMIPSYTKNKEIVLIKSGLAAQHLKNTLRIEDKSNFLASPINYKGMFHSFGVDKVFELMLSYQSFQLKYSNDFFYGVATNYLSSISQFKGVLQISSNRDLSLDDLRPIAEIRKNRVEFQKEMAQKIVEEIKLIKISRGQKVTD